MRYKCKFCLMIDNCLDGKLETKESARCGSSTKDFEFEISRRQMMQAMKGVSSNKLQGIPSPPQHFPTGRPIKAPKIHKFPTDYQHVPPPPSFDVKLDKSFQDTVEELMKQLNKKGK